MFELVADLLNTRADLVLTVTAPLDRRRPNNHEDRIGLRNLVAEARRQVSSRTDPESARAIIERLGAAAASVDLGSGAHGVVIVVTTQSEEAHLLSYPVRPGVSLGNTPATRFLVQGLRRSPRYRLLVVSDRSTRLFHAVRDDLEEVTQSGFPFTAQIRPRDLRAIAGRFAQPTGRDDKEQWRNFYRTVDQALTEASRDDPLPIVLAGVNRSTTMFEDVSRNAHFVIGRLDGAHDHADAHDLGRAAWPILRDHLKCRQRSAIAEIADARHTNRAVTGITDSWRLARQGRGRLLVVEENYRAEPSREVGQRLVPAESGRADTMDDPVDELIEHVVRGGGTVEFVAPDALVGDGRIGLMLR